MSPDTEHTLIEAVVSGDLEARNTFFEHYEAPMHRLWRSGPGRKYAKQGLDLDYIHWFLTDWLMRPHGTFERLRVFLVSPKASPRRANDPQGEGSRFLAWWLGQAKHRWVDFHREKVLSRRNKKRIRSIDDACASLEPSDPTADLEQDLIANEAARELRRCLDDIVDRRTLTEAVQRGPSGTEPASRCLRTMEVLEALGCAFSGNKLVHRRGRVGRGVMSAAARVGRVMTESGYDQTEIARGLHVLIDSLLAERPR